MKLQPVREKWRVNQMTNTQNIVDEIMTDSRWSDDEKKFIVRAVNSHGELIKSIRNAIEYLDEWEQDIPEEQWKIQKQVRMELKEAIQQAEGK